MLSCRGVAIFSRLSRNLNVIINIIRKLKYLQTRLVYVTGLFAITVPGATVPTTVATEGEPDTSSESEPEQEPNITEIDSDSQSAVSIL